MAYPVRWDEIAAPAEDIGPVCSKKDHTASLRVYLRRLTAATVAVCALFCLSVMTVTTNLLSDRQGSALRLDSVIGSGIVASTPPKAVRRLGFLSVTGSIVNRTAGSQNHVEAIVDLLDSGQHTLSSQSAMIDRHNVDAGQESSFRVEMVDQPAAAAYRLRFRKLYSSNLN